MNNGKTQATASAKALKKALETIGTARSITLPIEITFTPGQAFIIQCIAARKKQTISKVFADHFELDDRLLVENSSYAEA